MNQRFASFVTFLMTAVTASGSLGATVDTGRLQRADVLIEATISRGDIPGAVLVVGQGEDIVYRKAYGCRAVEPKRQPMTADTVFDLASLTKVVACATSVMLLAERGEIVLTDRVERYLPEFGQNGKESITVEDLLLHRGGLVPDNPMSDYHDGPTKAWERICELKPNWPPRSRFAYTDVGYIVLGKLVEAVGGRPLDRFVREEVYEPLGMTSTMYQPTDELESRCAPTTQREGEWIVGEVHDPRAYALGGVAGHAGLFSTADDLARYCRMILNGGVLGGRRVLSDLTVREMTRPRAIGEAYRGYGWDIDTGYSSPRGDLFEPMTTFGHTGFTGTSIWLDPAHDCYVILLTNRVHPDGHGSVVPLRRRVANAVASALVESGAERRVHTAGRQRNRQAAAAASGPPADVKTGIDVLEDQGFRLLQGKRVGLITNHTGLDREGNRTLDVLFNAEGVELVRLFSPEHGLYGKMDEKVGHGIEAKTRLPVYSLYGETRIPTPEMLEGLDTLVFDIQDIGARFYTYISTMGNCMSAAAKNDIEFVVLDRPNPITGRVVDGPIADGDKLGFTAFGRIPVVHGMTVGELARMFNTEHDINCRLHVVEMTGWTRDMWWDETGLMWINPSPNMRNLTQATLYPAIGLLEACNLSVGRGTDQPFEFLGAPWIDGRQLAAALNGARLPGLRFVPIMFTPNASKFADEACQGIYVFITDRDAVEPCRSGLTIAWHLRDLFGDAFRIDGVLRLLANEKVLESLKETGRPAMLPSLWQSELESFKRTRRGYLLYH